MFSTRAVVGSLGLAAILLLATQAPAAIVYDMTMSGTTHTDGIATFKQFSVGPGGTGNIDPFLRIQKNGTEEGFNTSGTPQLDTKPGPWTHAVQLSAIPEVKIDGVLCREFLLDINENNATLSLDSIKVYVADTGDLTSYPGSFPAPIYDLGNAWLKLDYTLGSGSGTGDMLMYLPSSLFGSDGTKYVYIYSKFGVTFSSDDGSEDWAYSTNGPLAPEPATMILLALGGVGMLLRRRR